MNRPFRVIKTEKLALTGASEEFTVGTPSQHLRIWGDRSFHFNVDASATTNDTPISAEHAEIIPCPAKDSTVNFIKAAGETDGHVWVSYIQLG